MESYQDQPPLHLIWALSLATSPGPRLHWNYHPQQQPSSDACGSSVCPRVSLRCVFHTCSHRSQWDWPGINGSTSNDSLRQFGHEPVVPFRSYLSSFPAILGFTSLKSFLHMNPCLRLSVWMKLHEGRYPCGTMRCLEPQQTSWDQEENQGPQAHMAESRALLSYGIDQRWYYSSSGCYGL